MGTYSNFAILDHGYLHTIKEVLVTRRMGI